MSGPSSHVSDPKVVAFEEFVLVVGARLRRVCCARFGVEVGTEAASDALAWAWEHWDEVLEMENPAGYLYRVAQSNVRRYHRWRRRPPDLPIEHREGPSVEPGLDVALANLRSEQRVAVVLVRALGWTYQEAAQAMGLSLPAVRNHVHRGMKALRAQMGEAS